MPLISRSMDARDGLQARSIKYQMTAARLPLARDLAEFAFAGTPINEGLVRDLASGAFIASQRNAVLVGGSGTGDRDLAVFTQHRLLKRGVLPVSQRIAS